MNSPTFRSRRGSAVLTESEVSIKLRKLKNYSEDRGEFVSNKKGFQKALSPLLCFHTPLNPVSRTGQGLLIESVQRLSPSRNSINAERFSEGQWEIKALKYDVIFDLFL